MTLFEFLGIMLCLEFCALIIVLSGVEEKGEIWENRKY